MDKLGSQKGTKVPISDLTKRLVKIERRMEHARQVSKTVIIIGIVLLLLSFAGASDIADFFGFSPIQFSLYVLLIGLILRSFSRDPDSVPAKTTHDSRVEHVPPMIVHTEAKEKPLPPPLKIFPPPTVHTAKAHARSDKRRSSLEADIGTKWFGRVGITSLVIGMAFFVKYAIDHGWIGPIGRIAIGILVGVVLLVLGKYFDTKKNLIAFSRTLTGGGFAVVYFTVYAAHHFYQLVPVYVDSIGLALVAISAILFSLMYDSSIIAAEAFLLSYVTAYLTGASTIFTLIYSLILTLSLLCIVYKKGWVHIGLGGLIATYILHFLWFTTNGDHQIIHLCFTVIYALIFSIMALKLKEYNTSKTLDVDAVGKYTVGIILLISFLASAVPGTPNYSLFIFYLIMALLGLFCSFSRNWTGIGLWSVLLTYLSYYFWYHNHVGEPSHIRYAFVFLPIYFLLYTAFWIATSGTAKTQRQITYSALYSLANTFSFYFFMYGDIHAQYDSFSGLFTFALAAFYLVLIYFVRTKKLLFTVSLVLCTLFFSLAIPIQLIGQWISISWFIEALALVLLGIGLSNIALRTLGYALSIIASGRLLLIDIHQLQGFSLVNVLGSTRTFVLLVAIVTMSIASFVLYQNKKRLAYEEQLIPAVYSMAGILFLTLLFYLETTTWTVAWWALEIVSLAYLSFRLDKRAMRYSAHFITVLITGHLLITDIELTPFSLSNILGSTRTLIFLIGIIALYAVSMMMRRYKKNLPIEENFVPGAYLVLATGILTLLFHLETPTWTSAWWALEMLTILYLSLQSDEKKGREMAYFLSALVVLRLLIVDSQRAAFDIRDIIGSTRFLLFVAAIIAFYTGAYLLTQFRSHLESYEQAFARPAYSVTASALSAILLGLELQHGWISVGWALFAIVLIIFGFTTKDKTLRLSAIALFCITILKVFFMDLRFLETFYRIVSFIVLGILLLVVSYIYAKHKDILKKVI